MENRVVNSRYPHGQILLQTHVDLSSRLTEGYMYSLTEDYLDTTFWM